MFNDGCIFVCIWAPQAIFKGSNNIHIASQYFWTSLCKYNNRKMDTVKVKP